MTLRDATVSSYLLVINREGLAKRFVSLLTNGSTLGHSDVHLIYTVFLYVH